MRNPNVSSSMDYTDKCIGCGLCCILPETNNEDCLNLVRLGNGLTLCSIHGHHTGSVIKRDGEKVWTCVDIMDVPTLYEGCPYNEDKIAIQLSNRKDNV